MKKEIHVCRDFFADKVKCAECKLWVDKTDATKVRHLGMFGEVIDWYCPRDKKPYNYFIQAFPENIYYGEVSMDRDGNPKGYKKIVEKNQPTKDV